ncbi:MAG: ankyrin repeat domain-containing protein [Alphaproteobacteria bacterium]|nr:ankyrin repeat domain-containing protein [Alphaproteobacteria bacterium]MBU2149371.1 ankyrin repeat domain-containing protein [Alphaproteobacteria bacterium]MBU2305331.1 ankyrin repeat domain-containing protein [Alphaproteobacteria bacterium]MBU2363878.1 ankyrin repeat domain-containing protein [Alphaproteobacteria bacterium]
MAPRAATPVESPSALAAKLRDAAARGRTGELKRLLAKGAPVDMPDDDGETALMRSIRANQPATAALLRRHGASLDLKNGAGESARDMATSIDDAKLNRALGLDG